MAGAWRALAIFQSGQPYSVIDYTGAVGSIFYGTSNGITNPIVPLAPGCTPKSALTGASGAFEGAGGMPALKASCFTLPLLAPGGAVNGVAGAIPSNDPYETNFVSNGERNIFRQSWQKRADISIVNDTKVNERVSVKYSFDVFNLTNTPSFDIPIDNVSQNIFLNDFQPQPVAQAPYGTDTTPTLASGCSGSTPSVPTVCTTTSGSRAGCEQDDWQSAADSDVAQRAFLRLRTKTAAETEVVMTAVFVRCELDTRSFWADRRSATGSQYVCESN